MSLLVAFCNCGHTAMVVSQMVKLLLPTAIFMSDCTDKRSSKQPELLASCDFISYLFNDQSAYAIAYACINGLVVDALNCQPTCCGCNLDHGLEIAAITIITMIIIL